MTKTFDYTKAFEGANIDKARLKNFVGELARIEAENGIAPSRVLINGIPPFPDVLTATFKIPKDKAGGIIGDLLKHPSLDPNIIINGIPALDHVQITLGLNR